jgi:Protein of unknown function (DUF2510)
VIYTVPSYAGLAIAQTVDDVVSRLERDLGVDGTGLAVIFCVVILALVVLLLVCNRRSKHKALRLAHAGRYAAADYAARSFRLQHLRSLPAREVPADPMVFGPARDASNPRFRPEVSLPSVTDPVFPALDRSRAAASTSRVASEVLAGLSVQSERAGNSFPGEPMDVAVTASESSPTSSPIAGWYLDPQGASGRLRYWDGSSWTEHWSPDGPKDDGEDPKDD